MASVSALSIALSSLAVALVLASAAADLATAGAAAVASFSVSALALDLPRSRPTSGAVSSFLLTIKGTLVDGLESNDGNPTLRFPFSGPVGAVDGAAAGVVDSIIGGSLGLTVLEGDSQEGTPVVGGVTSRGGTSLSPLSVVGSSGARTVDWSDRGCGDL